MTEENQEVVEVTGKTEIKPDTTGYTKVKSASGSASMHNGDPVATTLAGMNVDECIVIAIAMTGQDDLSTRYSHLNIGQQRMNLGNRIRGAVAKIDKANGSAIASYEKAEEKRIAAHNVLVDAFNADETGEVEEPADYVAAEAPVVEDAQTGAERLAEVAAAPIEARDARLAKAEEEAELKAAEAADKKAAKEAAAIAKQDKADEALLAADAEKGDEEPTEID